MIHILHSNTRPACRPLSQRLPSLALSTWTLTAPLPAIATSSGSIWSIGDPGICGVTLLGVWGRRLTASSCKDNAGPCESSTPITVAVESVESDRGSSYASPSDPFYDCLPVPLVPPSVWLCFLLWVSLSGSIFTLLLPLGLSVSGLWLGVPCFVLL